jgi:hypothetical protein
MICESCDEDRDSSDDAGAGEVVVLVVFGPSARFGVTGFVPAAHAEEDDDSDDGGDGEPGHSFLSLREDDEGSEERPDGGAGVSSDLEEGLGEAVLSSGGHAGDAGAFRMKDRGAHADEAGADQEPVEGRGDGEQEEAAEGEGHPGGEGVGLGALVGELADDGLEEGGDDLVGESEEAEVGEVEVKLALEDRVDRREQRLHHVVEEVAEADGGEDAEEGPGGSSVERLARSYDRAGGLECYLAHLPFPPPTNFCAKYSLQIR